MTRTVSEIKRDIRIVTDERITANRYRDIAQRDYCNARLAELRAELKAAK